MKLDIDLFYHISQIL